MWLEVSTAAGLAIVASALLTFFVRFFALSREMLDIPNARSSHSLPTPRGGGVAIVIATLLAFIWSTAAGAVPFNLCVALLGGGAAVALVGFVDDRRGLPPTVRLIVHFAAAIWALAWIQGMPSLHLIDSDSLPSWVAQVLGVLGIVWSLNLYNFMDGIDGIAGSEAIFVSFAGAILCLVVGTSSSVPTLAVLFGSACIGFLLWNWPPAKIFMGDVGSGFVGFVLVVLALAAAREAPVVLIGWLILGGVFFVDATVTLARRVLRREAVFEAHRTHLYQRLSSRWGSHSRVTTLVTAINILWLAPCAFAAVYYPEYAWWILGFAWLPLVVSAIFLYPNAT